MKFVLVNHRTPFGSPSCRHCSRPLAVGYLREIASQRPYCDHDCYRRDETRRLFTPWLPAPGATSGLATGHAASLGLMASLTAVACWGYALPLSAVAISLAQAALGMRELMTADVVLLRRPG